MQVVLKLFTMMAAGVQGQQAFLQAEGQPLEAVTSAKQVPVVGSQLQVNGVMTSMQCVISLTVQFLIVYTALAICRMAADSYGLKYDNLPIQKILQTATLTVNFAPMLAILFLACRMRVTQLTKGRGNPPEWIQVCMYFCTYSVLMMTLCVCVIPLFTGAVMGVDPRTGDIPEDAKPFENKALAIAFTVLKYLILLGLYGGALAVVYGIMTYVPPAGIWPEKKKFPVSPAVECTVSLACQYFIVYGLIQVARTWTQFTCMKMTKFEQVMMTATTSMNFAPMLGVLFIGARMRALNIDPVSGSPQAWAQNCFYMCTYALLAQTCFSVAVPLVLQGEVRVGKIEGDMEYEIENKLFGTILAVGRYVMMISIYVGACCIIYSIFTIQHSKGPEYTIPISATMQCLVNLTFQFFFVYTWIWVGITIKEFTGFEWVLMTQTMENCKGVVMFCPMLAILFVGTRLRALLLTNNRGAPQGWCQDGMYMATWSLLIQFLMVLVTPCATGVPAQVDDDGNIKWEPDNKILFYCVVVIRFLGFFLLYGGVITVIIGVYTMTAETANGRGAVPLVGDGKIPGTDTEVPGYDGIKEPYGANDIAGVGAEGKGKPEQDASTVGFMGTLSGHDAGLGLFLIFLLGLLLGLLIPLFPSLSSQRRASEEPDPPDTETEHAPSHADRYLESKHARNPSSNGDSRVKSVPGSGALDFQKTSPADDPVDLEFGSLSALPAFPSPTLVSMPGLRALGNSRADDYMGTWSTLALHSNSSPAGVSPRSLGTPETFPPSDEIGSVSSLPTFPSPNVVSPRSLSSQQMEGDVEFGSLFSQVLPFLDDRSAVVVRQLCRRPPTYPKRVLIASSSTSSRSSGGDSSLSSRRQGVKVSDKARHKTIKASTGGASSSRDGPRSILDQISMGAARRPRQYYLMDLDLLVFSGLWKDQKDNFWKVEENAENHLLGDIRRYKSLASFTAGGSLRQGAISVRNDGTLFWEMRGRPGYGWVLEYTGHLALTQTLTWRAIPSGNKFVWSKAAFPSTNPDVSGNCKGKGKGKRSIDDVSGNSKGKGKGKRCDVEGPAPEGKRRRK